MTFDEEMAAGFDELAQEAGTGGNLSFKGVPLVGIIGSAAEDPMKVDLKMGALERLTLEVSRVELAKLTQAPKVGEAFTHSGRSMRIADINDEDPTSVSVIYTVRKS